VSPSGAVSPSGRPDGFGSMGEDETSATRRHVDDSGEDDRPEPPLATELAASRALTHSPILGSELKVVMRSRAPTVALTEATVASTVTSAATSTPPAIDETVLRSASAMMASRLDMQLAPAPKRKSPAPHGTTSASISTSQLTSSQVSSSPSQARHAQAKSSQAVRVPEPRQPHPSLNAAAVLRHAGHSPMGDGTYRRGPIAS
jgi:hypothetical protein